MFDKDLGGSHVLWLCRRFAACAAVAILGWASQADSVAAQPKMQIVAYDMGGDLTERVRQIERLRQSGTEVRIEGTCVSACTLYLGLPKSCVTAGAVLGFHGPRTRIDGLPLPREEFDRQSALMAGYYPQHIRQWFWSKARMVTRSYYTLSGGQAAKMGARLCA